MLGTDFARTLRAAQAGEEDAFVRLWRDANPAMVRYLRVVGHDDPYDEACEGWVTVVRGLPAFDGDETHWRAWVLGCARKRAEESTLRRSWGASTGSLYVDGDGDIDLEEVLEPEDSIDPTHRGIADTLSALRHLPLGQGEVVVLRLGAELPPDVVADVVGLDEDSVQRAELRALERLGTETDLVSWSLTAPPSRAELADEKIAVGAFRKVLSRARAERVKVIAVGAGSVRAAARQVRGGTDLRSRPSQRATGPGRSRTAPGRSRTAAPTRSRTTTSSRSQTATTLGRSRTAKATGRSRTAVLAITALSLSLVSLGGFGAAAYVGVLPAPVQQAMHDAVGAPAPAARDAGSPSSGTKPVVPTAKAGHPTASSAAAAGLCRAWSTDQAKGTARERSAAFQKLSTAAGGPAKVQAYCSTALAPKPSRGAPTASVGGASPTGSPTAPGNGKSNDGKGNGNGQGVQPSPATTPGSTHTPQGKGATKATTPAKGQPTASKSATPGKGQPTASKSAESAKSQPTAAASPTPGPRFPSPKSTK